MSASPSLPSDRGKWKKRRRNTTAEEDDDEDEEDEFDHEDDNDRVTTSQCAPNALSFPATRENEAIAEGGVRISDFPVVIRHNVDRPHSSVLKIVELERSLERGDAKNRTSPIFLENVSYGQLQAKSCPAFQNRDNVGGTSSHVVSPQIYRRSGILKNFMNFDTHIVPMHAEWFSPTGVHRLERQVVPHFFSGKSPDHTPEKYLQCRNAIISMYLKHPEKRFSFADYQKPSDDISVEDVARIFRFLDHWGIINYSASKPNSEPWSSETYLRVDVNGDLHVPSDALKSIDSLIKFDTPKCRLMPADGYVSVLSGNNDAADLDNQIRERLSDYQCNCCSQPVPIVHYQSQKQADVLLCTDCFHDGKFIVGHSSIDFMRVDLSNEFGDMDGESWTDQETLLLLEAVEKYNDNWNEIADHVGTKSKSECILHFVNLPVGEDRLENVEIPATPGLGPPATMINGGSSGVSIRLSEAENRLPFANSKNPVMSLVAFVTSALGPRVAAACAHSSLMVLSEDDHPVASGNSKPDEAEVTPFPGEKVESAVRAGVTAAAVKAKLFAEHEEREIQRLSANIINQQLKRLELKLKQFAEVETMLMKECEQVERARQRFASERARLVSTRFGLSGISPTLNSNGPGTVISAPMGSQPIVSGFGSRQPIQPIQPFMTSQQVYSAGVRPPSTASIAANLVFNSSGHPQQAHSSS